MLILMDFLNGKKKKETKSAFDKIKRKNWIFFFKIMSIFKQICWLAIFLTI